MLLIEKYARNLPVQMWSGAELSSPQAVATNFFLRKHQYKFNCGVEEVQSTFGWGTTASCQEDWLAFSL